VLTDPPELVTTDLRELVEHIAETIEADYPDAKISIDCPPGLSATIPTNFESAVEEIVRNAVIHNDSANPSVRITGERDDGIRLSISDTGPEIPEMERSVLLGDRDQTAVYHGSGLGLWLVNLIVSRSGGSLQYETVEPRGNCIEITLGSESR
jgi:signal transduction histidine kinase